MWRLSLFITWSISVAIGLGLIILSHDSTARRFGGGSPGGGFLVPIQSVSFGPTFSLYGNGACPATKCVSADTFFSTWDDLGNIVMTSDDTTTWNATSSSGCCNVMLSTLSNFSTSMTGTTVRTFASESGQPGFGNANQTGSDGATWKVTGMMSVQGMLILSVGRQYDTYNAPPPYPTELAASLWSSTNHGASWTPTTPACNGCDIGNPATSPPYTFVDKRFVHVFFVQYGQDYQTQTVDRSNQYVYAMSPDYSSAHLQSPNLWYSDVINLGRITIANLKANPAGSTSSWQFYQGGDGSLDANWGALSTTVPVVSTPGHFANFLAPSVQYLPAFGQYLMLQSSDVARGANDTGWNVFTASHLWGPWALLQQTIIPATPSPAPNGATGFYWPGIVPSSVATDGGRHIVALSSANFTVASYYTMYIVPITVQ